MDTFRLTDKKMHEIHEVWGEIAKERHGEFKHILCKSPAFIDPTNNKLKRFELHLKGHKNSKIILSTSEKHPLKVEYIFKKHPSLEFQIYPEDFIEKISKFLGAKEIEVGDKAFDNKFIIKATNKAAMTYILSDEIKNYLINSKISSIGLLPNGYAKLHIVLAIPVADKMEMDNLVDFSIMLIERIANWKKTSKIRD